MFKSFRKIFRNKIKFSTIKKASIISLIFYQYKTKTLTLQEKTNFHQKYTKCQFNEIQITLKTPLEIGKPQEITLKNFKTPQQIILLKLEDGLIRAFHPFCPYDNKSNLKNAVFIQDKIICSSHGCEFNINSGFLENGPSLDHMIIFPGVQNSEKTITLKIPEKRPISRYPLVTKKNPNDFRKIAIIGSGPAGIASAENLRKIGYEGQILVFTKETSAPVQKHNLTKYVDFRNNRKMLFFRDYEYFKNIDVNIFYGMGVKNMTNDFNHVSFLEADDGGKYLYDGAIVASGDSMVENLESERIGDNVVILNNVFDFKKSERLLKNAKSVVICYITFESLELASTLRREFPDLKVNVLEISDKNYLENNIGKLSDGVIKYFRSQGVKFHFGRNYQRSFEREKNTIKYIHMKKKETKKTEQIKTQKRLKSDILYIFSPNRGSTKTFLSSKNQKNLQTGQHSRILTNTKQRTYEENVFTAGSASGTKDPITQTQPEHIHHTDALNQAEIAAYNIMGLDLPLKKPFFSYYEYFGKNFQKVGVSKNRKFFDLGKINDFEFLRFFVENGVFVGAVGVGVENNRRIMLLREALKLKLRIFVDEEELENESLFFQKIFDKVNGDRFGGCFAERFWDRRFLPVDKCVLFKDKGWYEEMNISRFVNKGFNLNK